MAAHYTKRSLVSRRAPKSRRVRLNAELLSERIAPAVFNVNSLADIFSPPAGVVTLRSAIRAANATPGADIINLTVRGTYGISLAGTNEQGNATGDFDILPSGDLSIVNNSGGQVTINGNNRDRVFDINPQVVALATPLTVNLSGITITRGQTDAAGSGGGIRAQGAVRLALNNVVVTANRASQDGGGVAMVNSVAADWTLTLDNTTVSGNRAADAGGGIDTDGGGTLSLSAGSVISGNTSVNQGGGIWLDALGDDSAHVTLDGTLVSGNHALTGAGGGVGNAGNGTVSITGSSFLDNTAGGDGGAFGDANDLGTLTIDASTFLRNSATGDGGAILERGPITTITNSELDDNFTGGDGGALLVGGVTLNLQSSTFSGNLAGGNGGAIELQTTGIIPSAQPVIVNTTLAGNSALCDGAQGGGLDVGAAFTGGLLLLNDTIYDNSAAIGGGLFWAGDGNFVSLRNTIIAGNSAAVGPDAASNLLFVAHLDGSEQVPPTGTEAFGTATLALSPLDDSILVNGKFQLLHGAITAFHLHNAPAGVNGPVATDAHGNNMELGTATRASFDVTPAFVTELFAGRIYTNVHTTAFPTGEIRDQFGFHSGQIADLGGNVIGIAGDGSGSQEAFQDPTTRAGTLANPLNALLGPLQDNGGPVVGAPGNTMTLQTAAPTAGSPALDNGIQPAPDTDARGIARATIGPVDAGAVQRVALVATGQPIVLTEGIDDGVVVASFSYGDPSTTADSFAASIDWGDGTSSDGTISGANGTFTVSGAHAYGEAGAYTITVTITDLTGATAAATVSGVALVLEGDLNIVPARIATGENIPFNGTVATFTDPGSTAPASAYGAVINWGDGTQDPGVIFNGPAGSFIVTGAHTYAEDGNFTVSVTVTSLSAPRVYTATLNGANEVPPINTDATGQARLVVSADGSVAVLDESWINLNLPATLVHIHDGPPGANGPAIYDAAGVPAVTTGAIPEQTFSLTVVQLAHLQNGGVYTNIHHSAGNTPEIRGQFSRQPDSVAAFPATVAEDDLVVHTIGITATEGQLFSGPVGTFSDPAADAGDVFDATIHWGDGTTSAGVVSRVAPGQYMVSGEHTYIDEGTFPLSVIVTEAGVAQMFFASLSGANEVPPTTSAATGEVVLILSADRLTITLSGRAGPLQGAVTGVPFHIGAAGETGPVATDAFGNPIDLLRNATYTVDSDFVDALLAGNVYVNIVTDEFREGEIRGQLAFANLVGGVLVPAPNPPADATVADADVLTGQGVLIQPIAGQPFTGVVAIFSDTYTASVADDFSAIIDWGDGTPGNPSVSTGVVHGGNGSFSVTGTHTYAASGVYPIVVTMREDAPGTAIGTAQSTADVQDAAPVVQPVVGPALAVPGQTVTISAAFTDASIGDTHTATINWGDGRQSVGTVTEANGAGAVTGSHVYTSTGTFPITVTVKDNGGQVGAGTGQVKIVSAAVLDDPLYPGKKALFVGGTNSADTIRVQPSKGSSVELHQQVKGGKDIKTIFPGPVCRIVIYGLGGDDNLKVEDSLKISSWLYGGDGSDTLDGGGCNAVLVGGAGNDTLTGGGDRSILLSGAGANKLNAGKAGDLLIAGTTDFETNDAVLASILAEWTKKYDSNVARDYSIRVNHLRTGGGLNTVLLNRSTIHDNRAKDQLHMNKGRDLIFAALGSGIVDKLDGHRDDDTKVDIS